MKTFLHVASVSFALPVLLASSSALAQDPALPPAPPPVATPPVAQTTVAAPPLAAEAAPPAAPAAPPAPKWYDALKFEGFVDGYAGVNYNFPKPESGPGVETSTGPGYLGTGEHNATGNVLRGYDQLDKTEKKSLTVAPDVVAFRPLVGTTGQFLLLAHATDPGQLTIVDQPDTRARVTELPGTPTFLAVQP